MRKIEIKVHCKSCNKELIRKPSDVRFNNFCNHTCYSIEKKKLWSDKNNPRYSGGEKNYKCLMCQNSFQAKGYGDTRLSKFCSHKCCGEYRSKTYIGNNHHNWRDIGGRITKPIRSLKNYKLWRLSIFERDNYSCIECGSKEKLHIHHLVNLAEIVTDIIKNKGKLIYTDKRLFDINNGITLCINCHRSKHKKMGRIAGTPI